MAKYFKDINTLEILRKQYKELLKKYHPDNGGDVAQMQEVNAEYDQLFKLLKNKHETGHTDKTDANKSGYENMKYDFTEDAKLREMLNKIISFHDITIEIVGAWIWLSGNTYSYKKELKEYAFKWASQKKMWYWHSEAFRKKSHKSLSMDAIRNYYGSTKVYTDTKVLLEA